MQDVHRWRCTRRAPCQLLLIDSFPALTSNGRLDSGEEQSRSKSSLDYGIRCPGGEMYDIGTVAVYLDQANRAKPG